MTVFDFGAVGDGVADDTSALQAWLDAGGGYLDPGTFRITESPVLDGTTSLFGAGLGSTILLEETDRYLGIPTASCVLVFGRDETWRGFVRDIHLRMAAPFVNQCYAMVLISAESCTIGNVVMTDFQASGGSGIAAYFNGLGISHNSTEKQHDIDILYNKGYWLPANAGMEFSSNAQSFSKRWNWTGNRAEGFGDDFIVTRGDDFVISNNRGVTDLGRIYATSVTDGLISGNTLVKRNSRGNSAGIVVGPQVGTNGPQQANFSASNNVIISDNTIINDDDGFDLVSPLEVQGGNNILVRGNNIIDKKLTSKCAVRLGHAVFHGVEYKIDDVAFCQNQMDGAHFAFVTEGLAHNWRMTAIGNVVNGRDVVLRGYTIIDQLGNPDLTFEHNRAYDTVDKDYNFQGLKRVLDTNKI